MAQATILLEVGVLAVCFGVVLTRRGYISTHDRHYPSTRRRMHIGVALIVVGFGCIVAGAVML